MKKKLSILLSIFIIMSLVKLALAEVNEKESILHTEYFGSLVKAKKIKKSGKIKLIPWDPYVKYSESIPDNKVLLQHTNKQDINYDEIWVKEMDDFQTTDEKRKYKGQQDIVKIYWLKNKIQGSTLEKYYVFNPITNKKIGKHKITEVLDRDSVLNKMTE